MKHLFSGLAILLVASTITSCVVLSPKKYKALLAKQDSLNNGWTDSQLSGENLETTIRNLRKDTADLIGELTAMQKKYADVDGKYSTLRSNSSSQISKLSGDLKAREQRLQEVEEALRKRDEATHKLRATLQNALFGFTKSGRSVDVRNGKVYVSLMDKLLFPTASIIIDEKGKQALTQLAEVLKSQPEINIAVEGHTDAQKVRNLGQIKDNWDLSVLRSTSVVRFLTEVEKVEGVRMTATGKGEYQPLADNDTVDSRSRNRRIEIVLSPKLDEVYNLISK